jgi:uncharacterized protein (TIGR02246 family)
MTFMSRARYLTAIALAGLVLLFGAGCSSQKTDVSAEIGAVNQQLMTALAAGNGTAIAALYTEDGQLMPPNSPAIQGRPGISAFWQGAIGAGIKSAVLKTTEAVSHGDTAYEVGEYQMLAAGGLQVDAGKYIVVWKRIEGQWKLHRDIWNTNGK